MKQVIDHSWALSVEEARIMQCQLATQVVREDRGGEIHVVTGVDVAYTDTHVFAAAVSLCMDSLEVIETATSVQQPQFPYIPGLFAFRELPAVIAALQQLQHDPDLIICDGHGIAHPQRCGLASHLGLLIEVPTIGCAKTNFIGSFGIPGEHRGDYTDLCDADEVIGSVLRTQHHVKPLFVSVGHLVSLESARKWILNLAPKYRLPETTRRADTLANELRKTFLNV